MSVFTAVDAQDAIVARIQQLWADSEFSDVGLHGNNGPGPNLDAVQRFVNFEIEFNDAEQATLGSDPITRIWGYIEFKVATREGRGRRAALAILSHITQELRATDIEAVKTLIPSPGKASGAKGWVFETLYIPFYFDGQPVANTHG